MIKMRPYQKEAVLNAREMNWQGILEMATGTGKTYTSLFIAEDYFDRFGRSLVVIIVPFEHLIDQWIESLEFFGYDKVISLQGGYQRNQASLNESLNYYRRGFMDKLACVVTYASFTNDNFQKTLRHFKENLFLIADECHNFGTNAYVSRDFSYIPYRIGLSATPIRHFDEEGSEYIAQYFVNQIIDISLEDAIDAGYLTPYSYEYFFAHLTKEEHESYLKLTQRIAYYLEQEKLSNEEEIELKNLQITRSQIIKAAENKIDVLIKHLSSRDLGNLKHVLIYCAVGTIDEVTKRVSDLGLRVHIFDHRVKSKKRQAILKAFDEGHIQVILAMHCLDEGVDVPATKEAYFLASTSNPREFIQRRGRVLRTYPGKTQAKIYDFITLAPIEMLGYSKTILSKELPRFIEFSHAAMNKYEIFNKMFFDLKKYDLDDGLFKARKDYYENNK